jgi:hypothetical protein
MPLGWKHRAVLLGIVVIAIWLGWTWIATERPRTAAAPARTDPCIHAIATVEAYRPPGRPQPVEAAVRLTLTAESYRAPVMTGQWEAKPTGEGCEVWLPVRLGRESPMELRWQLDASGRVEALNDQTRDMSGW